MRWFAALIATSAVTPVFAEVDGIPLAQRIVAAQNAIWPDEVFQLEFSGCILRYKQVSTSPNEAVSEAVWWLDDFETDPNLLIINGQRIGDGTRSWVTSSIHYPLRSELRTKHADAIARYEAAWDEIDRIDANQGWNILRSPQSREMKIQAMLRQLYEDRSAGAFGVLLQRNNGWAKGIDALGVSYFHPYGLIDTSIGFSFRDDVMNGLLTDIHAYRLENCPNGS